MYFSSNDAVCTLKGKPMLFKYYTKSGEHGIRKRAFGTYSFETPMIISNLVTALFKKAEENEWELNVPKHIIDYFIK